MLPHFQDFFFGIMKLDPYPVDAPILDNRSTEETVRGRYLGINDDGTYGCEYEVHDEWRNHYMEKNFLPGKLASPSVPTELASCEVGLGQRNGGGGSKDESSCSGGC